MYPGYNSGRANGNGGIELQSSTPSTPAIDSHPATLPPSTTAAAAAAAMKDDESFLDQLLRHQPDSGTGDDDMADQSNVSDADAIDAYSVRSEEDRKLPAVPVNSVKGRQRKPISRPYSKNHVTAASKCLLAEEPLYPRPQTINRSVSESIATSRLHATLIPEDTATTPTYRSTREVMRDIGGATLAKNDRSHVMKKQSSFYKAAFEAATPSDSPANDLSRDEEIARELSRKLEKPPPPCPSDEELARALQAAQDMGKAPEDSAQDVEYALQLMQQEEKEKELRRPVDSTADVELAMRLSAEMSRGTPSIGDEMLARQLSQLEGIPPHAQSELVPEQLQILERIQQDKEREQLQRALQESSLNELPIFDEPSPELGVGISHRSGEHGASEEDFRLSQELAMREWAELRRGERNGGSTVLRPNQSWSANDRDRNLNNSWTAFDERPFMNITPGRAVSVDVRGRETSIEPRPQLSSQRPRSSTPESEQNFPSSSQDLHLPRPPDDLLQRGNQETRAAIASGQAHVVKCQGCNNRLHAPISYSLVFCPTCNTISPGLTADGDNQAGEHLALGGNGAISR